jgi:PAS domain S-box-containing protein
MMLRQAPLRAYLAAAAFVALGLLVRWPLRPFLGLEAPFLFVFPVVILSGWIGGLRVGLFATVLASLGAAFFLIAPVGSFGIERSQDLAKLVVFFSIGLAVSGMSELMHQQRARAEESAAERDLVLEAVPALVSFIDPEHRYRWVNRAYEEWFGLRREETLGRHMREVLGDAAYEKVRPRLEQAFGGEAVTYTAEVAYRTGGTRWIEATYTPQRSAQGSVRGVVALVVDVTRQQKIEAELRDAVRARDVFLSIASHELRTPLTPLSLHLQGLLRLVDKDPGGSLPAAKVHDRLTRAYKQIGHLERLIADLLDVTRLTEARITLKPEPVDLVALAQEVVARTLDEAQRVGSTIEVRAEVPVQGEWDRLRLDQVATNLVHNALKYGRGKPIRVEVAREGERAVLRVEDEGIGIAPADQARIFDRFARAVSDEHYGGFGLGLWISRQMLAAMGGTIDVQSEVGRGSTFTVTLPLAPRPA